MAGRVFLSRFTPSRTDPDVLEEIFVQREALAKDTEERLVESALGDNKHHILFIGPRGSGKTHLVTLLFHRLNARDDLRDRLRIAWLAEDETTTSFLKFLLRIYRALSGRYPGEFPAEVTNALRPHDERGRITVMSRLLVEKLQGRSLLVLVENLDEVFKGLGAEGEKDWRAFLQENPVSATLATSQRLFAGVSRRDSPFFGSFQVEHLKPLSPDDAADLLLRVAELNEDAELADFLRSPIGRSRVRALHHLSGGNYRIYIVLSDFITAESLDELVGPFEKLLDELTPYYQARLSWLSPQQREIVEFLCKSPHAVPVKEIADRLLITHQTATGQLKDLREKGYVLGHTAGRESRYELAEPLMRLSVEVKENNLQPIRLIVDFLRVWHSREQLEERLRRLSPAYGMERQYVQHAIREYDSSGEDLRVRFILRDLEHYTDCGDRLRAIEAMEELAENRDHFDDWIRLAKGHYDLGLYQQSAAAFDRALVIRPDDADAWYNRGIALGRLGRHAESLKSYDRALAIRSDDADTWVHHGITLGRLGRHAESLESFDRALSIRPDHAGTWGNRGIALGWLGRHAESLGSYDRVLEIDQNDDKAAHYRIEPILLMNQWDRGYEALEAALTRFSPSKREDAGDIVTILQVVHTSTRDESTWKDRLGRLIPLYAGAGALTFLGIGLVSSLIRLRELALDSGSLATWSRVWQDVGGEYKELQIPLRIFVAGIRYLQTNDPRVLLDLVQEERKVIAELLEIESEEPST